MSSSVNEHLHTSRRPQSEFPAQVRKRTHVPISQRSFSSGNLLSSAHGHQSQRTPTQTQIDMQLPKLFTQRRMKTMINTRTRTVKIRWPLSNRFPFVSCIIVTIPNASISCSHYGWYNWSQLKQDNIVGTRVVMLPLFYTLFTWV